MHAAPLHAPQQLPRRRRRPLQHQPAVCCAPVLALPHRSSNSNYSALFSGYRLENMGSTAPRPTDSSCECYVSGVKRDVCGTESVLIEQLECSAHATHAHTHDTAAPSRCWYASVTAPNHYDSVSIRHCTQVQGAAGPQRVPSQLHMHVETNPKQSGSATEVQGRTHLPLRQEVREVRQPLLGHLQHPRRPHGPFCVCMQPRHACYTASVDNTAAAPQTRSGHNTGTLVGAAPHL